MCNVPSTAVPCTGSTARFSGTVFRFFQSFNFSFSGSNNYRYDEAFQSYNPRISIYDILILTFSASFCIIFLSDDIAKPMNKHFSSVLFLIRWARGWVSSFRFPIEAGNFSLHHRVQNGSGAHPATYPMGTRGYFLGVKAAGALS
jgi:hypothetical protein